MVLKLLTPGGICQTYHYDRALGYYYRYEQLFSFRNTYLPSITNRFGWQVHQVNFTTSEVCSMQEMCGFEILVRWSSPCTG